MTQRRVDVTPEAVRCDYEAGANVSELSRRYGLSRSNIRNRLREAGTAIDPERGLRRFREANPRWTLEPTPAVARGRARRWFPTLATPCEECGTEERLQRHHRDQNPGNNIASNIAVLCISCHSRLHRRLEREAREAA